MMILGVGEAPSSGLSRNEIVDPVAASIGVRAALKAAEENGDVIIRSVGLATLGGPSEYALGRRARNSIACLEDLGLGVCDVALPPVACECALLDGEEKQRGVLMIDLGAGKTGHVLYQQGELTDYGCHRVGSAHATNDLSMGLRIPLERAEALKIQHGNAMAGNSLVDAEDLWAIQEQGESYSDAELMQVIIYLRLRAILEKVRARVVEKGFRRDRVGAGIHLTGGGSMQRGIEELVSDVFGLPTMRARAKGFLGDQSVVENPRYACALGLLKLGEWRCDGSFSLPFRRTYFGVIPE